MNSAIFSGNLGSDPEIIVSQSGTKVGRFSLAVRRRFAKEGEVDTDWFRCTAFGKTCDFIEKYLRKGSSVIVQGEVQNNDYEKDGVKHYSVSIIVNSVEFAGKKSDNEAPTPQPTAQPQQTTMADYLGVDPSSLEEDLPFV